MAMRVCGVSDDRLFAFVDGVDETLDDHVAGCDECQAFLAELWIGEAPRDFAEPVLRTIRFDEFVVAAAKLGVEVVGAMGRALVAFGFGGEEADEPGGSLPANGGQQ
jgi:hypothetical protein